MPATSIRPTKPSSASGKSLQYFSVGVGKWPDPNRSDPIRSKNFGFILDSNEGSDPIGLNFGQLDPIQKFKKIKTKTNINLWFYPIGIYLNLIGSNHMFGLSSFYIFFNPINLKFDRIDPNPNLHTSIFRYLFHIHSSQHNIMGNF